MRAMQGAVAYGKGSICFSWFYADRKTLEIAVHPDTSVVIKAPAGTGVEEIKRKVFKRAGWILRQQNFFRQFEQRTIDRHYVGGETHLYLGKHYRLKIKAGQTDAVKLKKGFFEIELKDEILPEKVKQLLVQWYAAKAATRLRESFDLCWEYFAKNYLRYPCKKSESEPIVILSPSLRSRINSAKDLDLTRDSSSLQLLRMTKTDFLRDHHLKKPRLQIKRMPKRWGSLSPKGTLTLNIDLIRAPKECIEYVVIHELCHLQHRYHDPAFYRFLEKMLPDWQKRKHKLEVTLA